MKLFSNYSSESKGTNKRLALLIMCIGSFYQLLIQAVATKPVAIGYLGKRRRQAAHVIALLTLFALEHLMLLIADLANAT